jgi:hypothetical protein
MRPVVSARKVRLGSRGQDGRVRGRFSRRGLSPNRASLIEEGAACWERPGGLSTDEREELQRLRAGALAVCANAASLVDRSGDRQPRMQAIA